VLPARNGRGKQAAGSTAYLENGRTLEKARQMAAHASTRTTRPYDRREDRVTLDEVVKINIRGRPVHDRSAQTNGPNRCGAEVGSCVPL